VIMNLSSVSLTNPANFNSGKRFSFAKAAMALTVLAAIIGIASTSADLHAGSLTGTGATGASGSLQQATVGLNTPTRYFPSDYTLQATEIEPQRATF
jgi:hypothetical protein